MKTLAKISGVSVLLFCGYGFAEAQANNSNTNAPQVQTQTNAPNQPNVLSPNQPRDGAYNIEDRTKRRVVPPALMREADIAWQTRIWRLIDTREKINQQLYYPEKANLNRISLFELLKDALLGGEINAYNFNIFDLDDCESIRLTKTEIQGYLFSIDTIADENGNMKPVKNEVTAEKIRGYMLKEDWHFEKQRSVLDPRILWICPRIVVVNKNTGQADPNTPPQSLFWMNFDEIRPLMAKTPVFNPRNDAEWRTFDDIFWKRQFNSYIVQQRNMMGRSISAYYKGFDALLEGEKIHNKILDYEINLWQY